MSAPATVRARPGQTVVRAFAHVRDHLAALDRVELVALLLLLTVLVHTPGPVEAGVQIVAVLALVYRPAALSPLVWLLIAGLLVANSALVWFQLFNHSYLILYACLAVGLALLTSEPERVLARSARLVLALVFLFAVFSKAISPDFPSGGFFEFTLITDERFEGLAEVVGGLEDGAGSENVAAIQGWASPERPAGAVALASGPRIGALADLMAVWTLIIEGALAALFLVARSVRVARWAELGLILFIVTTYVLAPVVGFGWVLLVLGLAQTRLPARVAHVAYPAVFVALPAFNQTDELWRVFQVLG